MGKRKRVELPVTDQPRTVLPLAMQRCDRLSAVLTVKRCVERYRLAAQRCLTRGSEGGVRLEVCLGCPVGRAHASTERREAERAESA